MTNEYIAIPLSRFNFLVECSKQQAKLETTQDETIVQNLNVDKEPTQLEDSNKTEIHTNFTDVQEPSIKRQKLLETVEDSPLNINKEVSTVGDFNPPKSQVSQTFSFESLLNRVPKSQKVKGCKLAKELDRFSFKTLSQKFSNIEELFLDSLSLKAKQVENQKDYYEFILLNNLQHLIGNYKKLDNHCFSTKNSTPWYFLGESD
jgi:hypothetical protein